MGPNGCGAGSLQALENRSPGLTSSPKKGTEMLTRLVKLQSRFNNDRGATAVEYGLMVALIAIVIIAAVTLLGGNLSGIFNDVATSI